MTSSFIGGTAGLAMTNPSSLGQSLPKLTQESELQKMLTDEKIRSEQHKTNYQTLKAEHTRVQDENRRLTMNIEELKEEKASMEQRLQLLISKTSQELSEKIQQVEELKRKIITPDKIEVIKSQVAAELEQPFRERVGQLNEEMDHYRSDYNKLRYEHSFLKSEFEHAQVESKRILEETTLQYETEIENLRKDREAIVAKYTTEGSHDTQRVCNLHRENAQLNLKVKGLLTELEELRAQREQVGLQSDHVTRLQARQMSEHVANIKGLEAEIESFKSQANHLQKELQSSLDAQRLLNSKVHDLEKENMSLSGQVDESTHNSKIEITNMKMELLKVKGELERERDALANQIEGYITKIEVLQRSVDSQSNSLADKAREMVRKVQAAREEEWQKNNTLETEKLELEAKLQEREKLQIEQETQIHAEKERWEEQIKVAEGRRDQVEKDLLVLRAKFDQHNNTSQELDQERQRNAELREKLHSNQTELLSLQTIEQELNTENDKFKNSIDMLNDELRLTRNDLEQVKDVAQQRLEQQRLASLDEKQQLQKRLDELEDQIKKMNKNLEMQEKVHKKKKKKYQTVVDRLKDKIQILEAKQEQLELENQTLRKQIPKETYSKAVRKLRELQRKQSEFKSLLAGADMSLGPIANLSITGVLPTSSSTPYHHKSYLDQDQHQRDVSMIKRRLEELGDNQKQQLDILLGDPPQSARSDNISIKSDADKENNIVLDDISE
ncbi:centrosomal protein of 83 kDa-like [Antedon mediterranea]|uniref:centrosomal protein of 83 kDa-like n=1 Tax=Antedon mediterranea TaxID=105859 RepID=UPI003AF702F4